MGEFRQISAALLLLIYVENLFPCSILGNFGQFSLNFVLELILSRSGLGLFMG